LKNSKHALIPENIIDSIMELLSEERVTSEIDEPIDLAAQAFQFEVKDPLSHPSFNRVIGRFVRHLYERGLRLPRLLSDQEALTEAVSLLEKSYRGIHTVGYDGALLDASRSKLEGLDPVLSCLAESIKEAERGKYVEWVFFDNVDQLDRAARYQLVSTYLTRYKNILPPHFQEIDPAQLADHFKDLILNHLSVDSQMKQGFGADMSWIKSWPSSADPFRPPDL